ncbi:MAG: RNA polymerase sigma factor [Armatimonadetes bacterium]|nr:RNA polymerase sigma factor [Armatimonadota bacterium]
MLAGDRLAAGRLTERHRRTAFALAYRTLGNADDAQDVAQEALVYALQRLPDLRARGRFAAWLRHVTLSLCADYRRRRGTRRLGEPLTAVSEASEENDFAERLAIRDAVAHLPDALRTTLLLHYVGGWSREEVADILAIPLNTVRSRLMAAKRRLRADLGASLLKGKPMPAETFALSENHTSLIQVAFPGASVLSVQPDPEPWQPFTPRVKLALADGTEKTVDFRGDIDPERAALVPVLERLNIPGPPIIHGPVADGNGFLSLCEVPRGENLTLWALGGTPHRIRLATERAFEGIDRLQGATDGLMADPIGAKLPRRTLSDEAAVLTDDARWNADPWLAEEGRARTDWLRDPWFAAALDQVKAAVADIHAPLVYTSYMHFFPQGYRIAPGAGPFDEPLGWPRDPRYGQNPLTEFVYLWGHFGDPLLGLAMVWVYDCYPFVHTGFVEQFLWRRGATRREFAPRLALKALQMVARDLPVTRPTEGGGFWDGLRGWVDQALGWM